MLDTSAPSTRRLRPPRRRSFAAALCCSALLTALASGANAVCDLPLTEALQRGEARFIVLRHEKKGPDRRPALPAEISDCQRRFRGRENQDFRVLLQEDAVHDAARTRAGLDAHATLAPILFHSRYCRSLETALAMLGPEERLVEIAALDLYTGNLESALAEAARVLDEAGIETPAVLITHKDRFGDLGLAEPVQGAGYVISGSGTCLATVDPADAADPGAPRR
ncbi:MAG: hypothetical protein DWQ36_25965 [Acidobacteria bacterium]|nr:MAG: hypothetical protein DWQ30_17790 [Acidobacteriota bacterium]REJ99458.1 MAG: hypothetical protein DWQ36_25965 [Acidobacteriota bacterium]